MSQTQRKSGCRRCYFSRLIADILHCVKNPPTVDLDTGEARWPAVKQGDICGRFRLALENHIDTDPAPKNNLPIHTDHLGDYCKIPLTQGRFTKVDPDDYPWLSQFKWHCQTGSDRCYAARNGPRKNGGRQKTIFMHRVLASTPPGLVCDHINANGLDNRKKNLRNCTKQQNNMNARARTNSTSKFKGVFWHKAVRKYNAVIHLNGKRIHLGYFDKEVEAAKAYDEAAREYHREFANLNFSFKK